MKPGYVSQYSDGYGVADQLSLIAKEPNREMRGTL
jgi:hypothetical protein